MKFLKQFGIILVFSFIGELLNHVLPLPVPVKHLWNYIDVHLFKNWVASLFQES